MTTSFAPRTCKRCGHHYTAKPGRADLRRHRFGVCKECQIKTVDERGRVRDYSNIKPITDEADDTRPVWQYRTPTGIAILMPDDLKAMSKRLSHYFTNRLGMRMDVIFDLDHDMRLTGSGCVVGPDSGRIYAQIHIDRIVTEAA